MSSEFWFGFLAAGVFRLILSSASLLFILKSGCLNSQACRVCQKQPCAAEMMADERLAHTVIVHSLRYCVALCESRTCSTDEQSLRNCCA